MPEIKAIIFDLGNVLIRFDYLPAARALAERSRLGEQEIINFFFESQACLDYNAGKIRSDKFFRITRKSLGINMDFSDFSRLWNSCFFSFPEMEEMVYTLKERYNHEFKLLLLSNINELNYQYIKERFKILNVLDELILSYKVKINKPAPEIYQYAIKASGTSPENILYTDDRPELISAAKKLKINAFTFKDPQDFKNQLSKYGIRL